MNTQATKLATLAQKLNVKIDECFANRETNTPKRLAQARHKQLEGARLKRTQDILYRLSYLHEVGSVPTELQHFKTVKSIRDLIAYKTKPVSNGYHYYYVETEEPVHTCRASSLLFSLITGKTEEQKREETLQHELDKIKNLKLDGFFPTPANIVEMMLDGVWINQGAKVLEPSAGSGNIVASIRSIQKNCNITAIEWRHSLANILTLQGKADTVINGDFLEHSGRYDFIFMNPPFEKQADIEHVIHAFNQLSIGGYLCAIMSAGTTFRTDQKSVNFREFLKINNATVETLPLNAFKESGTGVNTIMIKLYKTSRQ